MFIRDDMVAKGRLLIEHVAGVRQIADILTKQLPKEAYNKHMEEFGMASSL